MSSLSVCPLTFLPHALRYEECRNVTVGDVCCLQAPVTGSVLQRISLRPNALGGHGCFISRTKVHVFEI